jgi:hypothetical protein
VGRGVGVDPFGVEIAGDPRNGGGKLVVSEFRSLPCVGVFFRVALWVSIRLAGIGGCIESGAVRIGLGGGPNGARGWGLRCSKSGCRLTLALIELSADVGRGWRGPGPAGGRR